MARSQSGESVLQRVVRIMESFGPETPSLSMSSIARRADLPLATASRLVNDMIAQRLLMRDPDGRVRVGLRLWELAARAAPTLPLREVAMPFMQDLHGVAGHHVQLAVLDGDDVLFIERLAATEAVINITKVAGRLPLHASSSGLILLAFASSDLQERVVNGPLRTYTPATIATAPQLRAVLAEIRRQHVVICRGHIHPDACGIAVPIRSPEGAVVAALSVVVPNDSHAREQVPALMATARGISETLVVPRWTHAAGR